MGIFRVRFDRIMPLNCLGSIWLRGGVYMAYVVQLSSSLVNLFSYINLGFLKLRFRLSLGHWLLLITTSIHVTETQVYIIYSSARFKIKAQFNVF